MERWNTQTCKRVENAKVDAFLAEVIEVSRKHGLSISHADNHGEFLIEKFSDANAAWLMEASDNTEESTT